MKNLKLYITITSILIVAVSFAGYREWQDNQPMVIEPAITTQPVEATPVEPPKPTFNIKTERLNDQVNSLRYTPLIVDPILNSTAKQKCRELAVIEKVEHGNIEPIRLSLGRGYFGENLAYGFNNDKEIFKGWRESPTHYQNLVDTGFSRVGYGVCDFQSGKLIVQHFSN